jgi:hypothetical protein
MFLAGAGRKIVLLEPTVASEFVNVAQFVVVSDELA